jgi:Ca2+-binding RTX toxin-like protein
MEDTMQSIIEKQVFLDAFSNWNIPISKGIEGDAGNNILSGDANVTEHIFGWGGNDTIYGGQSDYLYGGTGDDILVGAVGYDYFSPGEGFDTIVLNDLGALYRDEIVNFNAAQDKIQLNSVVFKGLDKGALSASLFYIGQKGTGNWNPGAEDRLLYDKTQMTLDYKTETGALIRLAKLSPEFNTPDLSHLNFFIVYHYFGRYEEPGEFRRFLPLRDPGWR